MTIHFDIVIVGGGLIGTTLAIALSPHFKVAVIEKSPINKNSHKPVKDSNAKALALTRQSVKILEELEVWSKVSECAEAIKTVHVSSRGHFGATKIVAKELGFTELGFVVDADLLNAALNESINENVVLFPHTEIKQLYQEKEEKSHHKIYNDINFKNEEFLFWRLLLNSLNKKETNATETLTAKLLIGCDGTDSMLRKLMGVDAMVHDYQQTAIVVNLELANFNNLVHFKLEPASDNGHANIAYERFLKQGSIAMLPFGKNRVKCVWATTNEEAKLLLQMDESVFLKQVQGIFGHRLGTFTSCSQRTSYPLRSITSSCLYGQRFVLAGNAANTLHPVAAQGFNLGLRDVVTLLEILVKSKKDPGQIEVLKKYNEKRRIDHANTQALSHSLTGLGSFLGSATDTISDSILSKGILCFDFLFFVRQPILKALGVF